MEENLNCTEERRYKLDSVVRLILMTILLLTLGQLASTPILNYATSIADGHPGFYTILSYADFIGIWVVFILFMLINRNDRPFLPKLLRGGGNTPKMFLWGIAAGFVTNGFCILVSAIRGDIHLRFSPDNLLLVILCFFAVMIQSGAEELVCRHFMQRHLARRYKAAWVSVLFPSIIFAALHLANPGITPLAFANILVVGIDFALIVYYFDSFWMPVAMHTMWNFTQNIIFGLPNSGIVMPLSVFKLEASTAVDSFSYNVGFGVEGTILALIVLVLFGAAVIYAGRKKRSAEAAEEVTPE